MKIQNTDPRVVKAIELYKLGMAIRPIAKELKLDPDIIKRFIPQEVIRDRSSSIRNTKGSSIKDNAFEILTPEVLYWIGFLYADGHIEKEPRCRVSLTLSEKDITHLEKLSSFLGGGITLRDVTQKGNAAPGQINFNNKYYRLAFSSKQIYQKLQSLGFHNRKTYGIIMNDLLKNSRDFWRGVVDGDGWVCCTGDTRADGRYDYPAIGLSGTEETLQEFLNFIRLSGISTKTSPRKIQKSNIWKIDIHNNPAISIGDLLYKDAITYLDRKYQKYLEICSSLINYVYCIKSYNNGF